MSVQLKPLLLPRLVERRRRGESISDAEFNYSSSSSSYSRSRSASDITSPTTPTFSARGVLRCHSSASSTESYSLPSEAHPMSPNFTEAQTSITSLPDVLEESQDRDYHWEPPVDEAPEVCVCLCRQNSQLFLSHDPYMISESAMITSDTRTTNPDFDYDLDYGGFTDTETSARPNFDKRSDSFTKQLASKIPLFVRRHKPPNTERLFSAPVYSRGDQASLREKRSCSMSNLFRRAFVAQASKFPETSTLPSNPNIKHLKQAEVEAASHTARMVDKARAEATSTPLLPPLMNDAPANFITHTTQLSLQHAPPHGLRKKTGNKIGCEKATIQAPSSQAVKKSLSEPSLEQISHSPGSFRIKIEDLNDEWANKLGHANFTILPEPYIPPTFDINACRKLRKDWDHARFNYTKHLLRTGEHYGITSQIYQLTEEKWNATDKIWQRYHEITVENMIENGSGAFKSTSTCPWDEEEHSTNTSPNNLSRHGNKYSLLGDQNIIGPMVQAAATLRRTPPTKTRLLNYITRKLPFSS
ncbi:BgTH12-06820 [Blumeria graminis f. sp. triticale]|uniref:BgTH12-06820 n=1 Tax=Blumeria graminis f. sp. triticale TaxID=1689686 RepID=A0A9W4D831_BLUGR|nr:BgTH12-06820 [Blumeria graminis f. sp. triticale]